MLKKLKIEILHDPKIPLLVIYSKVFKSGKFPPRKVEGFYFIQGQPDESSMSGTHLHIHPADTFKRWK